MRVVNYEGQVKVVSANKQNISKQFSAIALKFHAYSKVQYGRLKSTSAPTACHVNGRRHQRSGGDYIPGK